MKRRHGQHESRIEQYVSDVLSGSRMACEMEKAAVDRYIDDRKNKAYVFDYASADYACGFFESMNLTQGEQSGKPFELQPVQLFCVWNIFGFRLAKNGLRRYREALIQLARGSGKTPLGVGLILLAGGFHPDVPQRANNYMAATKKDQAKIGFEDLKAFVEENKHLRDRCDVKEHKVTVKHNSATFEYLASDGRVADGLRIQALLKDEIHAWNKTQHKFESKLSTGLGKFPEPLSIMITTAGDQNSDLWKSVDSMSRLVVSRDNEIDISSLFVMICELDEADDIFEIENYHKSSPLMAAGITKQAHIEGMIEKAKINPDIKNDLIRFHANRRVQSGGKPITPKTWALGSGKQPDYGNIVPHAGVDLGWCDDLAAIAYVWRLPEDIYRVEWDIFIPQGCKKRDLNADPWSTWIASGLITVTESEWLDPDVLYLALEKRIEKHGIKSLAADPSNAREFMANCVNKLGIENTYPFAQSHLKYNEPVQRFIEMVSEGRLKHGDNPVAAWCASNVSFKSNPAGHRMPDKEASDDKIDPIVAAIMAISEAHFAEQPFVSRYEDPEEEPLIFNFDEGMFEEV